MSVCPMAPPGERCLRFAAPLGQAGLADQRGWWGPEGAGGNGAFLVHSCPISNAGCFSFFVPEIASLL